MTESINRPEGRTFAEATLLDEFAMRFAPELIKRNTGCGTAWNHVAKDAYDAAEAMMEERRRRVSPNAEVSAENEELKKAHDGGAWFSYDPGAGFEVHESSQAAENRASECLDYYKADAPSDGWSEEVTQVCWGKVSEQVVELWRKHRPPPNELDENGYDKDGTKWGEWDELVDYGLMPAIDAARKQGDGSERVGGMTNLTPLKAKHE